MEFPIKVLNRLGLSIPQAKVYLALSTSGPLKTTSIAKESNVARQDVYRTLNQLYELGIVEKIILPTAHFKALPIDQGTKILLDRKVADLDKIKKERQLLLTTLKHKNRSKELTLENNFVMLPKKATVNRIRQSITEVKSSISGVVTEKQFSYFVDAFSDELKQLCIRKIRIRIILKKENKVNGAWYGGFFKDYPTFQARSIDYCTTATFGVYDNTAIFLVGQATDHLTKSEAMWTNNSSLVDLAKENFEHLWLTAKEEKNNEEHSWLSVKK